MWTDGGGIAQVAAAAGFETIVLEVNEGVLTKGLARIDKFLEGGVAKARDDRRGQGASRLTGTTATPIFCGCDLVIEAIVENVEAKRAGVRPGRRRWSASTASSPRTPRRCA